VMKTDFVPKLVASVSACCAVYATVIVADRLLTVRTLASVGYFDALVGISAHYKSQLWTGRNLVALR